MYRPSEVLPMTMPAPDTTTTTNGHGHRHGDGSTMLEVRDLRVHFPIYKGFPIARQVGAVKAVDGISFSVKRGETVGLVGESGCGKSTTGLAMVKMNPITSGSVHFEGHDLVNTTGEAMRQLGHEVGRGRRDQDQLAIARKLDVAHRVVHARVPQIAPHRLAGQRLHGGRADKARRRLGHGHAHVRAVLDQQARELRSLVGRDAAGNAEQNAFAGQRHRTDPR
jgi:ABC-type glutathione transport system ATPase component